MHNQNKKEEKNPSHLFYKLIAFLMIAAFCYFLPSIIVINNWKMALGLLTIVGSFVGAIALTISTFSADSENYY
jgi:hypothetical protein